VAVLIPLGTDRPLARPTVVTFVLLAVNVAVFITGLAFEKADPDRLKELRTLLILDPHSLRAWSWVTYAFLHANFWHIAGNLVFLWVFGPNVEDRFGRIGFLLFYLAGAAAAGGAHVLLAHAPVLGASGAITAVTGAYLVLFPRTIVRVFFLLGFGILHISAAWFITASIAWDIFTTGAGQAGNVATLAHLGGYVFGIGVALFLLWTKILPREVYDLFSITKHAARRRQFREVQYQQQKKIAKQNQGAGVVSEPVALARGEVSEKLLANDGDGAAAAYRKLLEDFGEGAALLSRNSQYDIANALWVAKDHQTAATAYRLFLRGYPNDSETPRMRLMSGLINARYLNDPVSAKQDLAAAIEGLPDGDERQLARELIAELG